MWFPKYLRDIVTTQSLWRKMLNKHNFLQMIWLVTISLNILGTINIQHIVILSIIWAKKSIDSTSLTVSNCSTKILYYDQWNLKDFSHFVKAPVIWWHMFPLVQILIFYPIVQWSLSWCWCYAVACWGSVTFPTHLRYFNSQRCAWGKPQ